MRMPPGVTADCAIVDRELDRRLGGEEFTPPEHVQRHLDRCERCRRLYLWMTEPSAGDPGSPELYSRIERSLKASLGPVRPQPSVASLALRFWIVFLLLASVAIALLGGESVHQMVWPQRIGIGLFLTLAGLSLFALLAWQMTPGSLQRIPVRIAIPVLAAGLLLDLAFLFPWHVSDSFVASGWHCFKTGMAMAVPVAILFLVLSRRGAPLAIDSLAATLGAVAGLFGVTVLQFTCTRQEAGHLLLWHGGVLIVSVLMGVLIAQAVRGIFWPRP